MFKKMKENKKKGFTLVELIVVLVILAILAALLIPALTGYIDKAKNKSVVAETRQAVMAAQTLYDEEYAKIKTGETVTLDTTGKFTKEEIASLAELGKDTIINVTVENNKIKTLVYDNGQKRCTYNPANSKNNSDGDYNVGKSGEDTTTGGNTN